MINMGLDDNTIIKSLNISKEDLDNIKGSRLQLLFPFFISIFFNIFNCDILFNELINCLLFLSISIT